MAEGGSGRGAGGKGGQGVGGLGGTWMIRLNASVVSAAEHPASVVLQAVRPTKVQLP